MAFRRSRQFAQKQQRRLTAWGAAAPASVTLAAASTASLVFSLGAEALSLRPFTIIRTRGVMQVISDQIAQTESQQVGLGCCVVSDQAAAIGVTAVPTPFTDMASDLFHVYENVYDTLRFGSNIGFKAPFGHMIQFDSKAMRKVNEDQDVVTVLESSAISSGLIVVIGFRFLIKLH